MSSNRNLNRLPPHLSLYSKQLSKLSSYPRQPIRTTHDLLTKTELDLVECCDWDIETARDVQRKCAEWVAPKSNTVLELFEDSKPLQQNSESSCNKSCSFFTTTLQDLDNALGGGIPCSSVTEIAGPPRSGKTQFCMTLSIQATLPVGMGGLEGGVCFIDTEGNFCTNRLVEIAETRYPQFFNRQNSTGLQNLENTTKSIHIMDLHSSKDVMERLEKLQEFIIAKKIRLVIVDSVGSLVRKEFKDISGNHINLLSSDSFIQRNDLLVREAALLKFLAESFRIPVIVTNQLISKKGIECVSANGYTPPSKKNRSHDPDPSAVLVTVALGNTWAHSITTRLIIEYCRNDPMILKMPLTITKSLRRIRIAKSPIAPTVAYYYCINNQGIISVDPTLPSFNSKNCDNADQDSDFHKDKENQSLSEIWEAYDEWPRFRKRHGVRVADWFISALWA